ncbi:hypothetical protein ACIQ4Z_03880 [Peribacillus asahii]|uniref:hypothetical protein n=1 Tax=Peribacillus asahii TaxID=228899 RepID=UPI0038110CFB
MIEQFTNPAIAAFPYPSIHLPDWVEQAEIFFEEKQNQWATESAKAASRSSNVVPFNKKLRKHF